MQVLQIEIVPKKTTGSGNESCVWRTHPGYQKRERELNEWRERKKRNKNAKHVKCKDVLRFICGSYERRVTFRRPCQDELRFSSPWDVICCQGKQKWSELELRRLWVERYEHVDLQLRRQAATENSQMRTVGLYNIGALWRWSTFASCFVFGEVGELICSVGSLSPELQRLR